MPEKEPEIEKEKEEEEISVIKIEPIKNRPLGDDVPIHNHRFRDLRDVVKEEGSVPTHTPRNFFGQVYFYVSGTTYRFYAYIKDAWKKVFDSDDYADLTDGEATILHKHDHGLLEGLTDDDHTQYLRVDGSRAYTGTGAGFRDEDDMSSNDATAAASQQSIKAYIATQIATVSGWVDTTVVVFNGVVATTQTLDLSGTIGAVTAIVMLAVNGGGLDTSSFYGSQEEPNGGCSFINGDDGFVIVKTQTDGEVIWKTSYPGGAPTAVVTIIAYYIL